MASRKTSNQRDVKKVPSIDLDNQDEDSNDNNSQFSKTGGQDSNVNSSSRKDKNNQLSVRDQLTLDVVKSLKDEIQESIRQQQFTNEVQSIEKAVATIRRRNNKELSCRKWKERLPSDIANCPDKILSLSMAYGDDPERLISIIEAKMKDTDSTSITNENEDPFEKSLRKVTDDLKIFIQQERRPASELFRAVLDMNDNQIDRADRMFYAEARYLTNNPEDYEFENAHEQVQAIRLMNHEINNKKELIHFITKCRTFNEALSYLRERLKERVNTSETNTNRTKQNSRRPLLREVSPGRDRDTDNNNPPLMNSTSPNDGYSSNPPRPNNNPTNRRKSSAELALSNKNRNNPDPKYNN